ncbi:B-cell receptor CD22-like isoform X2 [Acanthopagrus latus]|uniref:B-cell receptor CD22-like isoform X2 n=1 Tax=Acanthopagrus latus TaxID=8177 RepID=UPI00187BF546|nr:B-cell receptor CD22-like isoform X2 [Acanthopagrus latus]
MERWILIILVIMPGVWSGDWGVTLKSQCALKGTSVVLKCKYDYPSGHFVTSVGWYKARYVSGVGRLYPVRDPPSSPGHFRYAGNRWSDCSLEINDVQHTDEGQYYFEFETTFNRWMSRTYSHLSVKGLTAHAQPGTVTEGADVSLTCESGCDTPVNIVWFKDGLPARNPVFQARREDAGQYHCAILGQESVRSASVALNVHYAPEKVTLSMNPSGDIVKGSSITFSCSSDASPPVTQRGYSLYKDGHFVRSGQSHAISDVQPSHSGMYYCQAWNNISRRGNDLMKSAEVHLDVQYQPMNISVSMGPSNVVAGSSVNLTCSGAANPAAESYTWYRRTASSRSMLQVGSGQVLSIPSMEASHTGLYSCQARNQLGESNSTEVLLTMREEQRGWCHFTVKNNDLFIWNFKSIIFILYLKWHKCSFSQSNHTVCLSSGSQSLPITAGIGVSLFVTLVLALLLLWRKQRTHAEKKTVSDSRLSGRGTTSTATEDQSDSVYVNIHTFPSSPPPATDVTPHNAIMAPVSCEDEVTYSTVTIKPRNPPPPHHGDRALQGSGSKARENDESVIYATVAKSR